MKAWAALAAFGACAAAAAQPPAPAELVVTGARIYTADEQQPRAQALAIGGGRLLYVGNSAQASAWIGPHTRVLRLDGQLVLPGLVDAHIHPIDIIDLDVCDLDDRQKTLRELSDFVRGCIARYHTAPGQWLNVQQWNYTQGNQPDGALPTLRAALDRASRTVYVQLLGEDGHHGAFNSAALALAKNARGEQVGLTRASVAGEFAQYGKLIGVDAQGEPDGALNEDARYLLTRANVVYNNLEGALKFPERITARLNSVGITAMLDAMVAPEGLEVYEKLLARGRLTVRTTLALYYDPELYRRAGGAIDYDAMVSEAKAVRARYAGNDLLHADTVKLFADGGLEGNPYAVPPTLPNAASLKPFLQPIYRVHGDAVSVAGYVDTASPLCAAVRAHPQTYDAKQFLSEHGFHPAQCTISRGQLEHERPVIMEFVKRFHLAGFNLHVHAISDATVRTVVDALEAARAADGVVTRDGIAHLQLADSADIARIGRDHFYVAFTYAWAIAEEQYDLTVIPFFERVQGSDYAALHVPGSYYEQHVYPARSVLKAGGILVAGSDAPVDTRDPRPFVNIATAITRRLPGRGALNAAEGLTLDEVLAAYTREGARFLGREAETGSLQAGKSADFIVLDRDITALAAQGHAEDIAKTQVLRTFFMGREVYTRAPAAVRGATARP
jgi:predicted amidohydrolase YtcJ